jgi:integrase
MEQNLEQTPKGCGMEQQYKGYGDGLYRYSRESGSASWVGRYQKDGVRHEIGLGSCSVYNLSEARKRWRRKRQMIDEGLDPKGGGGKRRSKRFRDCAKSYQEEHKAGWRSERYAADWINSLVMHAFPVLGDMPVSEIDTPDILRVLKPIWQSRAVTAGRVRQRVEAILDWARTSGERSGENPARWSGHLENLLPKISKVAPTEHFAALPYSEMPSLMTVLRGEEGPVAHALEFLILTAGRTDEVREAPWSEIDLGGRVWAIPAARMKSGREHRVALSGAAMALLEALPAGSPDDLLFTRPGTREALSERAMLDLLAKLTPGRKVTVHGLRSSFRDWVAEQTSFPSELAEIQLAHKVGSAVEAAYRRSDMFEKRRLIAESWGRYLDGSSGEVVTLPQRAAG